MILKIKLKKIENSDKFRKSAINYTKYGYYTAAPKGTTAWREFWKEERRRSVNGYTAEDGEHITGYFYFYLNYCQIVQNIEREVTNPRTGKTRMVLRREKDFPLFYDYDKEYFDAIEAAENEGKHLVTIKRRGAGYSWKGASMLCRNFFLLKSSISYAIAAEAEFLTKDGLLTKAWDLLDFIDEHTAWAKKRQKIDTKMHKRASIVVDKNGVKSEIGYKSEIIGVTLKNDPQKARGKRGKLILWEEAGKFPGLKEAWQVARPSVEEDATTFGLMIAYGCLTAGNKVWTNDGDLVNIEDLDVSKGIIGYDGKGASKETITYWQDPQEKECVKIETNTGRTIECSIDHPILWSKLGCSFTPRKRDEDGKSTEKRWCFKKTKFKEAINIKIGDQVAVIDEVDIWSDKKMWAPYLVGLLIGDGSYGFDKTPVLSNCDEEVNEYVYSSFNAVEESGYKTKDGRDFKQTRIRGICPNLRKLGIYGQTKSRKRLPLNVHSYCKEDVCSMLAGLFDADGHYSKRQINVTSACKELLLDVLLLLQKLGIYSNINEIDITNSKNPKDKNNYFRLEIGRKKAVEKFASLIQPRIKYKKENLAILIDLYKDKKSEHAEYIKGILFERVVKMEYTGMKPVYNLTANNTNTYIGNGIVTHNTGGTAEANYEGLKDLFYEPEAYNCLEIENIWDDGAPDKACGFFVPQYVNMRGEDKDKRVFMDSQGNSLINIAKEYSLREREKISAKSSDRTSVDRFIAERPFTPQEATLQISGNIFPKKDLIRHLANLKNNEALHNFKQVGELFFDTNGNITWEQSDNPKDHVKYRIDPDMDKSGAIVIWEHPVDEAPYGLYIGGCLTPGEKVLTDKGLKNVEEVDHNDKLVNKEGVLVDIKMFQKRWKEEHDTYRFKMSNTYRTTNFTRGHPLYVSKTGYNANKTINEDKFSFDFVRADKVKVGDWTKWPNVYKSGNAIDFEDYSRWYENETKNNKIANPLLEKDFWWFVGLWLGDGCCYNGRIELAFNKEDKHYINKTINIVNQLFSRKPYYQDLDYNGSKITVNSVQLCKFLTDNFGRYSYGKFIPEWVKRLPEKFKKELLLGYLASDGCITNHTKGYLSTEFVSVSLRLLEDAQDILFSLGIVSGLSKMRDNMESYIDGRKVNQKDTYHLRLSHHSTLDFVKFSNDTEDIKIKNANFKEISKIRKRPKDGCFISKDGNYVYFQIKKIEHSLYTGTVYNFECDTHNYISHHISQKNCDPYDHDKSGTNSLGSCIIYKRFQNFESYYDLPVAEYTGRPDTAEEYYEKVRQLLRYYNARLLYENEKKGLYAYFSHKHSEFLLVDQPDIIKDIIRNSTVQRGKGIHMNKSIKDWGEILIRDWLNEEYSEGKKNLTKIFSEPLLEEFISYNDEGNFDRVMAFMMVMIYKEELHHVHVKKKKQHDKSRMIFPDGIFKDEDKRFVI